MNAGILEKGSYRTFCSYSGLLLALVLAGASVPTPQQQAVQLKAVERATFPLQGPVYSLAFTADANAFACVSLRHPGSEPGEVRLWDRAAGREGMRQLPGMSGIVKALALTPEGTTLATGGWASADPYDKKRWKCVLKLWDAGSGKERAVLNGHSSFVVCVRFSPDGKILASAEQGGKLKLWDVVTRRELVTIAGDGGGRSLLEFTADGKTLAWAFQGFSNERFKPQIRLVDVATGKEFASLKGHKNEIRCLAFSPDGKTLASGGGAPLELPVPDGLTRSLGRKALGDHLGELKLWEVATGKERTSLQTIDCVLSVAFSPDGKTMASGGAGAPMPDEDKFWYWSGEVKLWDVATGKERVPLRGHPFPKGKVEYVAFSPDGTTLASAGGHAVKLWDTATGRELAEVQGDRSESWFWVGFTRNGMTLLSRHQHTIGRSAMCHELKVWDAPTVK